MASRAFKPFNGTLKVGVVHVHASITIGATGAVTNTSFGNGIKSVTRNSAGNYTIALQDSYPVLLGVDISQVDPTAAAVPQFHVTANNVASSTAPSVTIGGYVTTVATDPNSGATIQVTIALQNSSLGG